MPGIKGLILQDLVIMTMVCLLELKTHFFFFQLGQSPVLTAVPKTDHKQHDYLPTCVYSIVFYHSCTFWLYNLCSMGAVTSHGFYLTVATNFRHVTRSLHTMIAM